MKTATLLAAACVSFLGLIPGTTPAVDHMSDSSAAAILQDLRSFREMSTVLHVAAHPDDENTQLITYLARGRGSRMAYLSVTRGDGGQNVIGNEFNEELGVIRTQELLSARRLDGGLQFFTRAKDFGYSRDYKQTLTKWDREQVLSDIVRVIRTFRPDVIITRFSTPKGENDQPGGHGHHTSSAILALQAFPMAGDPKAFPEQLTDLTVWQPKRIVYNGGGFGGGAGGPLKLDVGGTDPVLEKSFAEISGRSRAMHKSQGFGGGGGGGGKGGGKGGGGGGPSFQSFQLLRGDPAKADIFEGVDTTWNRIPGGAEIAKRVDDAISQFNPDNPAASVPALLAMRSLVAKLPADPLVADKSRQLDRIVQACLGLDVHTTLPDAEAVAGETLNLHCAVNARSEVPVRWVGVRYPSIKKNTDFNTELRRNQAVVREETPTLPTNTPLSQPYWLRKDGTPGMFVVDDPKLIGRPENPPVFPVEYVFSVGGQELVVPDEPVQVISVKDKLAIRRRLEVIAPVSLSYPFNVKLFAPGSTRPVDVDVTAYRPGITGSLELEAPTGYTVEPAKQSFNLAKVGDRARVSFKVTVPSQLGRVAITAKAQTSGGTYNTGRVEIRYDHIPPQLLQPTARLKAVTLDMAVRGRKVGYVPGAGDSVAECVEQMGYEVTRLSGADLTPEKLSGFDAVIIGVRAFNVRNDMNDRMKNLFAYVENGGTVIEQYNRPGVKVDKLAPYNLQISSDRVTNEKATMTFLAPDHPALNTPNKITSADFDGWVQERGIYFPNPWDKKFVALLACNDPGVAPMSGSLLVARHGRGYFVYTGLSWFRQLPEGVPGAYRLFANLVSLKD
jgi:LmbE family N-acetylglucosaminyl deacetylase